MEGNDFWSDAREAEGAPLLREYRVKSSIEGSNPSHSARKARTPLVGVFLFLVAAMQAGNPEARLIGWPEPTSAKRDAMLTRNSGTPYNSASAAPVAQLDRAPGYELGGREFESLRARHFCFKRTRQVLRHLFCSRRLRRICGGRFRHLKVSPGRLRPSWAASGYSAVW